MAARRDERRGDFALGPPAGERGVSDAYGFGGDSGWHGGVVLRWHGATMVHDSPRFISDGTMTGIRDVSVGSRCLGYGGFVVIVVVCDLVDAVYELLFA